MKEKLLFGVGIALLLAVAGLTGCSGGATIRGEIPSSLPVTITNQQNGIWVSGEGKVTIFTFDNSGGIRME